MTDRRTLALEARKTLGMTQREFAALLGVGYVTVARWETDGGESRDPGAVGEALFHLLLDAPARCKRVLRRHRPEVEE